MKSAIVLSFVISALVITSIPALAHHGFAGRYDEDNPITVTGTVLELQFTNPHAFIYFEAKDEKTGKTERWLAEMGSAGQLQKGEGWTKNTLKAGDRITITGPRNKNGSPDMNLSHESRIVMADSGKEIHNSIKGRGRGQAE